MVVLGIDPGTAITGYGLVKENSQGELEVVSYGVINTRAGTPLEDRLLIIFTQLQELIKLHQPVSSAVEKLFFQRNVKTALAVGHARGVALLALAERHIPVSHYTPAEVKQAVSGYGGADKAQVQHMVKALLQLDEIPQPDDAADALAVAICHIHSSRFREMTPGK